MGVGRARWCARSWNSPGIQPHEPDFTAGVGAAKVSSLRQDSLTLLERLPTPSPPQHHREPGSARRPQAGADAVSAATARQSDAVSAATARQPANRPSRRKTAEVASLRRGYASRSASFRRSPGFVIARVQQPKPGGSPAPEPGSARRPQAGADAMSAATARKSDAMSAATARQPTRQPTPWRRPNRCDGRIPSLSVASR